MSQSTVSSSFTKRHIHDFAKNVTTQPTAVLENLARLASKPGVQSTLVLSRSDGSIIHKTGLLADQSTIPEDTSPSTNGDPNTNGAFAHKDTQATANEKSAESIAHKVFSFVVQAQRFAEGMDAGDEVRLLRLRTRRNELVIVPGKWQLGHAMSCADVVICRLKVPACGYTRCKPGTIVRFVALDALSCIFFYIEHVMRYPNCSEASLQHSR